MKKIFVALFVLFASCEEKKPKVGRIEIVTIDRCEYVVLTDVYAVGIIHKENCNNQIHAK